eukprot:403373119
MRNEYFNKNLELFLHIVTEVGDSYGVAFFIALGVTVFSREKAFVFLLGQAASSGLVCQLKSVYNEARPFFVVDNLHPKKCSLEHGDPSAHTMVFVTMHSTLVFLLSKQYEIHGSKKKLMWIVYKIFCGVLGFSRIYAGVHSYNQVLSGMIWGYSLHYLICHIYYDDIIAFIQNTRKRTLFENFWNPYIKLFLIFEVIAVILYFYGITYRPTPQSWLDNMWKNCPTAKKNIDPELNNLESYHNGFSLIGALMGLAVEQNFLKSVRDLNEKHFNTSFFKMSIRVVISVIGMVICIFTDLMTPKDSSFFKIVIFKKMIPTFMATGYLFSYNKVIHYKLGLLNTNKEVEVIENMQQETKKHQ